ncbi:nitrogen permease regulator 2-domain-containing protein [Microdochium bolleyi]|uniref:Nitrogen permease regulator 2-domain-containing protein n=1 Tax=Microdochium bolleyi TaxID=196109 RepID=A0A136IPT4_9PEZI|nr:nitrogen permease regulator 2-domain-containing protein [Microdochium bolleyi]
MIQCIFYARFLPQEGTSIVAQSPPGCMVASPDSSPNAKPPLLDFDIIQEYIIPRKAFFNRFMTVNSPDGKYSVLGFPVSIPHERYHRNEFIFNFGIVVDTDSDQIPYERLVRRLAVTFAEMERQTGYLSSAATTTDCDGTVVTDSGRRPIESLLEIVKEDLNNYGECMIPVDDVNTLNMKLFPYHPKPAPVKGWHVPVPKMKLADLVDPTWDLTLQKIIPFIDGVNDVRRVAWLADVSLPLTQTALQHLLYYDTILLLDMFFFGSCYAPRPGIHDFIVNRDKIVEECANYVCLSSLERPGTTESSSRGGGSTVLPETTPETPDHTGKKTQPHSRTEISTRDTSDSSRPSTTASANTRSTNHEDNDANNSSTTNNNKTKNNTSGGLPSRISNYQLIKLLTTFCVGRSIMEWIKLHRDAGFDVLEHIDVRRLVQFGVIKGLLYRVHKYVVSKQYLAMLASGQARPANSIGGEATGTTSSSYASSSVHNDLYADDPNDDEGANDDDTVAVDPNGQFRHGSISAARSGSISETAAAARRRQSQQQSANFRMSSDPLQKYTDGCHSFDQIITEQNLTDGEIVERLKRLPAPSGDLAIFYR